MLRRFEDIYVNNCGTVGMEKWQSHILKTMKASLLSESEHEKQLMLQETVEVWKEGFCHDPTLIITVILR